MTPGTLRDRVDFSIRPPRACAFQSNFIVVKVIQLGGVMRYLQPARQRFLQSLLWAVLVWSLLQAAPMQKSYLGDPDVEGLSLAIKLRRDLIAGEAAPVTFIDFQQEDWAPAALRSILPSAGRPDGPSPIAQPGVETSAPPIPLYVPRVALAQIIDFMAQSRAATVFVDVDASYVATPSEDQAFAAAIDGWRKRSNSPLLVLTRTSWAEPSILERNGFEPLGRDDPIVFGSVRMYADENRVVREIAYFSCPDGVENPIIAAPIYLATAARFGDAVQAKRAVEDVRQQLNCNRGAALHRVVIANPIAPFEFEEEQGPINYHMSVATGGAPAEGAQLLRPTATLRTHAAHDCGATGAPVAMVVNAMDVLVGADSGAASNALFCGAIVVIGSSYTEVVRDDHLTPYGEMPGAFIMANAARGLDLSGPLRRFPYFIGLGFVLLAVLFVFLVFEGTRRASELILNMPAQTRLGRLLRWFAEMLTHSLTVGVFTIHIAFLAGLVLTFYALDNGYWGVFAAPALAAAASNAFDEFNAMRRALLVRKQ